MNKEDVLIKVSANSVPSSVAGAMAEMIKTNKRVIVQAIGAGAVNQAVKSIAVVRGYVAPLGINIVCIPAFSDVEIEGQDKSAIKFILKEEI